MTKFPIGDVIMYGVYKSTDGTSPQYVYKPTKGYAHCATSHLWWASDEEIQDLIVACKEFDGFELHVGLAGMGAEDAPEEIEYDWQERRVGNQYTCSTKGRQALKGYKLVWLELVDADKAYDVLQENTAIPCAVRCDMYKYTTDERYRQVFDIANDLFIHYLYNEIPKDTGSHIDMGKFLRDVYDI